MKPEKKDKDPQNKKGRHEHPLPGEISPEQKQRNAEALAQAEEDMTDDADFTAQSRNDDLDEAESARLGDGKTDLI